MVSAADLFPERVTVTTGTRINTVGGVLLPHDTDTCNIPSMDKCIEHPAIEVQILGRLLEAQTDLVSFADEQRIIEFLRDRLREIPGVLEVHACLNGIPFAYAGQSEQNTRLFNQALQDQTENRPLQPCPGMQVFFFTGPAGLPGGFVLFTNTSGDFLCYEHHVRNTVQVAGRIVDHLQTVKKLTKENDLLGQTNKDLRQFNHTIAHDLRAPLRHIQGFAKLVELEAGPAGKEYLNIIMESSLQLMHLIDDLLAFANIGTERLHPAPVSVETLVNEIINVFQASLTARRVNWKVHSLPAVYGDYDLLKQAFTHLVDNALKYTRMRSAAEITIGSLPADGNAITIFVRDNGAGFNMDQADKLFRVFQRLHGNREYEGTGIGLASVQRIMQLHNGTVRAEGKPGKGATFYVTLPLGRGPTGAL